VLLGVLPANICLLRIDHQFNLSGAECEKNVGVGIVFVSNKAAAKETRLITNKRGANQPSPIFSTDDVIKLKKGEWLGTAA